MKNIFLNFSQRLVKNFGKIFWGKNLIYHVIAITLTYICVTSGFDWRYYESTRISGLLPFLFPAVILGFFLPFIVPAGLLIRSFVKKDYRKLNTGLALTQAAALGWLVSAIYKTFTGRPGPENLNTLGDISHLFRFGFLRGGVFWGWPSSHTTVAFAMAVTLFILFPKNKLVKYLSVIYAVYIGISVSMTIHWFSDFVAGAIFGTVVGIVVGKSFLEKDIN